MQIKDLEKELESVTDKVFSTKSICFGYILFSIIGVTQVIFNPDNILEPFKLKKEKYIMVMNLTPLPLEVLVGYMVYFIKMAEK
jgi:hypothetical protein